MVPSPGAGHIILLYLQVYVFQWRSQEFDKGGAFAPRRGWTGSHAHQLDPCDFSLLPVI